jgi:radical SAM superfamily enzyme with C-terminal helix-hairpin-helix motif
MVRKIEAFTDEERAALHSLAEMLRDKDDRDLLRRLIHDGTTLREIILAYRTQRRLIAGLKATAGLIVLLGGAVAALKSLGLWPK